MRRQYQFKQFVRRSNILCPTVDQIQKLIIAKYNASKQKFLTLKNARVNVQKKFIMSKALCKLTNDYAYNRTHICYCIYLHVEQDGLYK